MAPSSLPQGRSGDYSAETKNSYTGFPLMDTASGSTPVIPASAFPPATPDYFCFDDLLSPEEKALRRKVREVMEKEVAPIIAPYWEKAEFPFHIIPKLASLGVAGGTIKGYGCPELSITGSAIATAEIARVDARAFFSGNAYNCTLWF